jgi:predicted phosphodiesterase
VAVAACVPPRGLPGRYPRPRVPTAALADIHGNLQALEAVLDDPRFAAADSVVVLGDVVTGTLPAETFDRITAPGRAVRFLRGNADRLALDDPAEWYGWVRERLGPERLAAVAAWPLSFAIEVEGLGSVRCCHALPDDDERGVTRITPEADFAADLAGIEEPIVIGGHTHVQFDRRINRWRYVNVGAVGRPYEGRPGAYWALLGPDVELMRTEYDVEAAVAVVLASGQPNAGEVADTLLNPPAREEATAWWEATRSDR